MSIIENELYFIAQLGCDCDGNCQASQIYEKNLSKEDAERISEKLAEWSDGILYIPVKMSEIENYD